MSSYTQVNLEQLPDIAPQFGMDAMGDARDALGAQQIGMAFYRMRPGRRIGFGHRHQTMEEMYLVLAGSGRIRLGDEILEVSAHDVVHVPPQTMREYEAGPDGMELVAFGNHADDESTDMDPEFWKD